MPTEMVQVGRPYGDFAIRSEDGAPLLDVVIPVYNEERDLVSSVHRLHAHLRAAFPYRFRITIADNGSTDGTAGVADVLDHELDEIFVLHLPQKGRGRALAAAWSQSPAEILAYMDVDLSTDLNALLPLIAPLLSGHSEVAVGSRHQRGSQVVRGHKREVISRGYNLLLRATLGARFTDAQCGFKAVRREVAEALLPLVEDTGWFFDTELLMLAQRTGLRIYEVPVDWIDDPHSSVAIGPTAFADLKGIARLATTPLAIPPLRPDRTGSPRRLPAAVLLTLTAALLLAGLSRSGWANDYYAAAVQAGTQSWKAWLFGSVDAGNVVTVDKPPAALWIMVLSARIFGLNSWSLLVPQALEGVAAVAILYATVRRWFGPAAGLLAGAILALTPTAVVMFRYDNPDALLVLLMVTGGYAVTRAVESGSGRWLTLAGTAIGFAFLTKLLQAFLILPAFALVYLVAAPVSLRRRLLHLAGAGLAVVVTAGWYVALVAVWPAASRPYIGGSQGNSLLELTIGYNGLGRILGHEGHGGPHLPGRGGPNPFGGAPGITRLFGGEFASQISWLLPAALIALGAGLWLTRRAPRTDRTRAALILWGGWLLVSALTFSYMKGIIHEYYTVAMAPAIAVLLAAGVKILGRPVLAQLSAATGIWGYVLLTRTPHWFPALRYVVLATGLIVALTLLVPRHRLRRAGIVVTLSALVAAGLAPAAYAVDAAAKPHTGGSPTAGPAPKRRGGFPHGFPGGFPGAGTAGAIPAPGVGFPRPGGGFGNGAPVSTALTSLLDATTSTWAAATVSAMASAPIQLATRRPIMAIGGFSGGDPAPTLARFQQDVHEGRVSYFIADRRRGAGPGGLRQDDSTGARITAWVEQTFPPRQVADTTVYDLSSRR